MAAPPTTQVRRNLKAPQMEALYEAAYLRIFAAWEVFQEDATVRLMAGAASPTYQPKAPSGASLHPSLKAARLSLYSGSQFLLWHSPTKAITRISRVLDGSPIEVELSNSQNRLQHLGNIRHRVAHSSDDADAKFKVAALDITGISFSGSPGKLLRAHDATDPLNLKRWIFVITNELLEIAGRCVG
ncbi:hypothetical protein ACIQF8_14015 [Pseudarthrobacter sp. NPDC092184]|uniref:hypothetical protein n=1 Tax=unclassified Pseudarthrobacter TaxID=2647000 RepID=UPI0037F851A1